MVKYVQLSKMNVSVHLENVSMFFTDSYIRGVHLGEMVVFIHLSDM